MEVCFLHLQSLHASPHVNFALPGLRPFGVSLLYAGYDPHYQFQLYHSDPSGNYSGWKATCIGANNGTAQSLLKQDYKDEVTVEEAIALVIKVMSKTMDSTTLSSDKRALRSFIFLHVLMGFIICAVEFSTLTLDKTTGKPIAKIYKPAEIDALLAKHGIAKKDDA